MINATLILLSTQTNPIATFVLITIITGPYFNRLHKSLEPFIAEAFANDINLEYYEYKGPSAVEKTKSPND